MRQGSLAEARRVRFENFACACVKLHQLPSKIARHVITQRQPAACWRLCDARAADTSVFASPAVNRRLASALHSGCQVRRKHQTQGFQFCAWVQLVQAQAPARQVSFVQGTVPPKLSAVNDPWSDGEHGPEADPSGFLTLKIQTCDHGFDA